jgi:hypothetical protein
MQRAGARAQRWLKRIGGAPGEQFALRQLGVLLCERIAHEAPGPWSAGTPRADLPSLEGFLRLTREQLLALTGQIALAPHVALPGGAAEQGRWAELFGTVALSYARLGDLVAVAGVVRAAAHAGLTDPWLDEAQAYLLDQQATAGHFGLLARELARVQANGGSQEDAFLPLTVQVLWALCAVVATRHERGGDVTGVVGAAAA